jgi:hypothetical protein
MNTYMGFSCTILILLRTEILKLKNCHLYHKGHRFVNYLFLTFVPFLTIFNHLHLCNKNIKLQISCLILSKIYIMYRNIGLPIFFIISNFLTVRFK